jgi:hypothetical protein
MRWRARGEGGALEAPVTIRKIRSRDRHGSPGLKQFEAFALFEPFHDLANVL